MFAALLSGNSGIDRSSSGIYGPPSPLVSVAKITPHLYLCGARALNATALRDRKVNCVINATVELPNLTCVPDVEFVKVSVDDNPRADLGAHFDRIADKIEEVRVGGGRTLVHCVAGVSRSATLCIAYLVKYRGMSLREAYEHVKSRRPIVRPNNGFFRQLVDYECRLGRESTIRLVPTNQGLIPDVYEEEYRHLIMLTGPPSSSSASSASSSCSPVKIKTVKT